MVDVSVIEECGSYTYGGEYHDTNQITMHDFLENHLPAGVEITEHDGTYAEIAVNGKTYGVFASGNGDSYNHKIEFEEII